MSKSSIAADPPRRLLAAGNGQRRLPSQERAQQTVQSFFKATRQLLGSKGEKGLSANKVAEWAGVSIGAFYQYFTNKEALILAMAAHGQQLVIKRLDAYLTGLESDPQIAQADPRLIVRNGIRCLIIGFGEGKATHQAEDAFSRTLIRLAWTWAPNDAEDIHKLLSQVSSRLMLSFELMAHPQLPPPSSAQMFVMIRSMLGVLRYASLEKSPLLGSTTLEDRLTQMIWGMFDRNTQQAPFTPVAETEPLANKLPPAASAGPAAPEANGKADPESSLRRRPTQRRAEATIQTILKAVVELMEKHDAPQLTTERIAARSGFSIGTIYQYFTGIDMLVRAMSLHGQNLLYEKLNRALLVMEENPKIAEVPPHVLVHEIICLFAEALCKGTTTVGGKVSGRQLIRICWTKEHVPDYTRCAQRVSERLRQAIERVQHPNIAVPNDDVLFILTRALLGVTRSASIENSHLLAHSTLHNALSQMAMGMLVQAQPAAATNRH